LRSVDGLTEPFTVPAKLEIEHVMPQSWEANWPLPSSEPLSGNFAEKRGELVHTIGNLTLLTKKLNVTLSNAAWSTDTKDIPCKQKTIKAYSLMMLSKDIVDQIEWNEGRIGDRAATLFDHACKLWPAPPPKQT
jgi:uncharacterized protein DUF1524